MSNDSIDISKLLRVFGGTLIEPYVFLSLRKEELSGQREPSDQLSVLWMEYSRNATPTPADIADVRELSRHQTLAGYLQLPILTIAPNTQVLLATCKRIDNGTIVYCRLPGPGCLWAMVPNGTI